MRAFIRRLIRGIVAGDGPDSKGGTDSGGSGLFATSLWFGLVTGLLELGVRLGQRSWDERVTVASIRTNWHWAWMVPLADVWIFGTCGLILLLLSRALPRLIRRVATYLLCGLSALAVLLAVEGLHPAARGVLACGIALRLAPWIATRASGFRCLVRRSTPILGAVVALLIVVVGAGVVLAERRARLRLPAPRHGAPNVLLIVMDNVRADDLSLYGYRRDTTPNLDRLARRAFRFDRARSTAPWTLPSHASMFTGYWPHQLSTTVDRPLDATRPTLAEFLAGQGYDTAGFVANTFYCNAWYGLDRGFTRYEDFYANRVVSGLEVLRSAALGRRIAAGAGIEAESPGAKRSRKTAAMINRDMLAWLSKREDRPFFVFLNYYDAHAPFQPPDGFDRRYGLGAEPEAVRSSILRNYARLTSGQGPSQDPNAPAVIDRAAELLRDSYDSCIAYLDDQLGRLFDELERRELLANTLVIVTSDHGEHFGDRNLFGHGHSLYRPLLHVPLLIIPPSGPGMARAAGRVVRAPVSLRDLPATVTDILRLQDRSPFPGRSLARYWTSGRAPTSADPLLAEVEHQTCFPPSPHIPASLGPLQSLLADAHVYIRNSDGREELYNIEDDPSELHNLAGTTDAPAVLERLRHRLRRLLLE